MAATRTGAFPIGLRLRYTDWQRDLAAVVRWAKENGFAALDVGSPPPNEIRQVLAAGLRVGSVDVKQSWTDLASPDAGKRRAAAEANAEYARAVVPLGVRNFFVVVIPEDPARDRRENFAFAVDGYGQLCRLLAPLGARVTIEGWPGRPPHFSTLGCTPAECRALLREVGSPALGVNYDPSHLVRLGIDLLRFLREFAPRVFHVHAKDTVLLPDAQYEHGTLQPTSAVADPHRFGGLAWRYAIPGRGAVPWAEVLALLKEAGYDGAVSIELEDEEFDGSETAEKRGLLAARTFLEQA